MALKLYDKLKHAIRYWLLRRLPTCQNTVEMISRSMEQPLPFRQRISVKVHLWICAWCQWYVEQLGLIRTAARANADTAPDQIAGSGLSNDARERILRNLSNQN
jgi:hypothetical protein